MDRAGDIELLRLARRLLEQQEGTPLKAQRRDIEPTSLDQPSAEGQADGDPRQPADRV